MEYIIVGLGNPGEKYRLTRHNAGRFILEELTKTNWPDIKFDDWRLWKNFKAKIVAGRADQLRFLLVLPETFMNLSGDSVNRFPQAKKNNALLVVHDELALPLGQFRLSFGRSAGGHNGVESIIKSLGTPDFLRLRIGIGPKKSAGLFKLFRRPVQHKDYVLEKFTDKEITELKSLSPKIKEAIFLSLKEGREVAMNKFN